MAPTEFLETMRRLSANVDTEDRHSKMDDAMANLLRELGYGDAVDVIEGTERWYA
jgi:hypothetical protein